MLQPLQRLDQLSSELVQQLENCEMEQFDIWMEKRQCIFDELMKHTSLHSLTDQERLLAGRIQEMDKLIVARMKQLSDEARLELDKLNRAKRSKSMYDTVSYGDDSLFFDRKQ